MTPLEVFRATGHDEPGHLRIDSDMVGTLAFSVEHDCFESPTASICILYLGRCPGLCRPEVPGNSYLHSTPTPKLIGFGVEVP